MQNITNITPGLLPIPPNGWGAVEKIIWEIHNNLLKLGYNSKIKYLDEIDETDEIIHIHVANLANLAYERNIPYYFTMHDHHAFLYGKDSFVYKENLKAIKNAKKAFVPAKYLVDYFEGIPEYFSHGVNIDYFTPNNLKNGSNLLCIANNGFIHDSSEDRKGFGLAIETAKLLGLSITIAGPSNNKKYFEKYPSNYDKLNILYDLNENELLNLYQNHAIFLHLSSLEAGHPNLTLLEAMSCGLPVVGTFENNNSLSGMIIVDRNINQAKNACLSIINNYKIFKNEAIDQAKKLSWENRTKELLKYYNMNDLIESYFNTKKLNIQSKEPIPDFNINFINGAFIEIKNIPENIEYEVKFINKLNNIVDFSTKLKNNYWARTSKMYFIDWKITLSNEDVSYEYDLDFEDQRVYIALDSKSLGDTLAWFPYVDEFRKKHKCKIICSTFWNNLFKDNYPEIEFINPGESANNILAMYIIGWFYNSDSTIDSNKNPYDFKSQPLQKTACDILGLEYKEIVPKIKLYNNINIEKIVSIAIHGTSQAKYWNNNEGWQKVVDYLKLEGYRVILLSQEEDGYMGNNHPKGIEKLPSGPIEEVIKTLQKSAFFIGIGSGLSWLSWATGTTTLLISGFSYDYTETKLNTIRIKAPEGKCTGCFNDYRLDPGDWNWCPKHKNTNRQFECSKSIKGEDIIDVICNNNLL